MMILFYSLGLKPQM